jgi:hypothetical protein
MRPPPIPNTLCSSYRPQAFTAHPAVASPCGDLWYNDDAVGRPRSAADAAIEFAHDKRVSSGEYMAMATDCSRRLAAATSHDEERKYRELEQSFRSLAANEQWLAENQHHTIRRSD